MSLPKYKDLNSLSNVEEIDQEIFILQKNLFDLRIKKSTSQNLKKIDTFAEQIKVKWQRI